MSKKAVKLAGVLLGTTLMSSAGALASDARCGAGKCGSSMDKGKKVEDKMGDGKCGSSKAQEKLDKKMSDAKCGGNKAVEKQADSKCGAGKCGGSK